METLLLLSLASFSLCVVISFSGSIYGKRTLPQPPAPPTELKWFGRQTRHLPTVLPWKVYNQWSKVYGPLLSLSFPGFPPRKILLLSGLDAIETLYNTRSAIYSTRPRWEMARLIGRQNNVAFTPYGPRLRRARRFLHDALGPKSMENWESLLEKETDFFLRKLLSSAHDQKYNMVSELIDAYVSDTVTLFTYGRRASSTYVAETERVNADTGLSVVPGRWFLEGFPFLQYLPSYLPGMGFKRWALKARQRFEDLTSTAFEDSRQGAESGVLPRCFITDALASPLSMEEMSVLRYTAGSIYGAATDTTSALIHSALHLLSHHPSVQSTAYSHVSSLNHPPAISDESGLPYIAALIREVHRFRPVVNFIQHAPLVEDDFHGWRIERGMWVMGNIWSVCHDEEIYHHPEKFIPERHLDLSGRIDKQVKDPRELTFGFGRRRCPGEHFANGQAFIVLARLIYFFEIMPLVLPKVAGETEELDYTSTLISRPKREHFGVRLSPRSEALKEFLLEQDSS